MSFLDKSLFFVYGVVSIYPIQVFKNLLKNRLFATDFASPRFFLALLVVYSLSAQNALYAKEMSFFALPKLDLGSISQNSVKPTAI